MTLRGFDVLALPPNRFVNVILAYILRNADHKQRDEFLSSLEMPPEGVEADEGVWSEEGMGAAFEQAMNAQI